MEPSLNWRKKMLNKKRTALTFFLISFCLVFSVAAQSKKPKEVTPDKVAPQNQQENEIQLKPNAKNASELSTISAPSSGTITLITADDISLEDLDKSFSDLAIEHLSGSANMGERNPFAPGVVEEQSDPSSLMVQGLIVGTNFGYALINDQIFSIGDRIGFYAITDIQPGKVILKQLEDKYIIRMDGYSQSINKRQRGKYFVCFNSAALKKALELLATAGDLNIIIPEKTDGKVSVTFYNTDIMNVLASILKVNELEYAFENDILRVGPASQFQDGSDLKALMIPLNFATASELEPQVKTLLSGRGSAISDARTNTLVIKDHANVLDSVRKFLNSVDKQDPQVSIEAKVVDASKNFSRSLGIQWGFSTEPGNIVFRGNQDVSAINGGVSSGTIANFPITGASSGFNILVGRLPGNSNLEMQLGAAESTGQIRIISKPNVTTINNKPASIRSGITMYVKVEGGADEGPTVQAIESGIELSVTPQITLNKMIKMEISAIQSEADFSRTVDGIPSILDNTASTTVLVPDGETAVIGGLLRASSTQETKGIPGISKVPVLGWLFKSTRRVKESKELMIFITPKILDHSYFKMSDLSSHTPAPISTNKPNATEITVIEEDIDLEPDQTSLQKTSGRATPHDVFY
jgi:type IV pilus secretin PilQ/predicted competence protein